MNERKYQPMFPDSSKEDIPEGSRLNRRQSEQLDGVLDKILGPSVDRDEQSEQLDKALINALGPDTDAVPVPGTENGPKLSPEQRDQISKSLADLGIESANEDIN